MTGWGSQGKESEETDQQIWLPDVSVSVVHRCRNLLLSFSTCCLGLLGLEGATYWLKPPTKGQPPKREQKLCSQSVGGSTVYMVKLLSQAWIQLQNVLPIFFFTRDCCFATNNYCNTGWATSLWNWPSYTYSSTGSFYPMNKVYDNLSMEAWGAYV